MASVLSVILRLTGSSTGAVGSIMAVHDALELAGMAAQAFSDTAGKLVAAGIGMNAQLETSTLQFKTLMGSAEEAESHVRGLFKFAQATPFESGPIIEASRNLRVMGGDALDTTDSLTMVGDAAAATGGQINDLAFWTGRAYSSIQAGRPFGEAAQRLQELAVLSPQARTEMERLAESGASADQVWRVFTDDMAKFTGAMQEQAGTWAGLTSSMSDTIGMLSATATHEAFLRLEENIKRVNTALADPRAQKNAETLGVGLAVGVDLAAATVEAAITRAMEPIDNFNRAWTDTTNLVENRAALMAAVLGNDVPRALDILRESMVETQTDVSGVTDAISRHSDVARTAAATMEAAAPIYQQARDDWADLAHEADTAALAVGGYRDETHRAAAAQEIFNQQLRDARIAAAEAGDMITRHLGLGTTEGGMDVLTGGNLAGIEAITKARDEAARDAEKAAREQARAEEAAARDAERAQRDAARATEREWTAAHRAAEQAAVRAAKVQVAAAQQTAAGVQAAAAAARGAWGGPLQAAGGGGGGFPFMPTVRASRAIPHVAPIVIQNDLSGANIYGVDDLDRRIQGAVNSGVRSGGIRIGGVSAR